MSCNIHPYIQEWIDIVEKKIYAVCEEQELLVAHVKWCFEHEDIYIDCGQLEKYMERIRASKMAGFILYVGERSGKRWYNCARISVFNVPA